MNWQPGDYLAGALMLIGIGLLAFGHIRSIVIGRRAERELDKRHEHSGRGGVE